MGNWNRVKSVNFFSQSVNIKRESNYLYINENCIKVTKPLKDLLNKKVKN